MARQELPEKRTRNAKHFENVGHLGTFTAEIGSAVHFFDKDTQEWLEEDQTFVPDGAGGHTAPDSEVPAHLLQRGANWFLATSLRRNGKGIEYQIPSASGATPVVEGNVVRFAFAGIEFRYYNGAAGLKLEATFSAHRGLRTYSFNANLVGGARALEVNASSGALESDEFVIGRPYAIDANDERRTGSAWRIQGNIVSFDFDDTGLALPYTLDPTTTFNVGAGTNDGQVSGSAASYPPAYSAADETDTNMLPSRSLSAGTHTVTNALARWDTSSLSGQSVTAATLRIDTALRSDADGRNLVGEWYSWTPSMGLSNYTTTAPGSPDAFSVSLASIASSTQNQDITLSGAATSINKTGFTGVRMHVSGGVATGLNRVNISTIEHSTNTEVRLIVDYTTALLEALVPDGASIQQTNYTGAFSDIDEDPASPGADWMTLTT